MSLAHWRWMAVAPSGVRHLIHGWKPPTGSADMRFDAACGGRGALTIEEEDGSQRCADCLRRVIGAGK